MTLRGSSGWYERTAEPMLPYVGHLSPGVVWLKDGSRMAMGRVRGVPHELASAAERNSARWADSGYQRLLVEN